MTAYILITGASKGIGKATALHLDSLGYHVFAGVRKERDADLLKTEASDRLTPITLDVIKPDSIEKARTKIETLTKTAGLHALINNAGVAVGAPLEFVPLDDLRWQLEVNVIGQVAVTQAFMPLLRQAQNPKARLIFISSIAGKVVAPLMGPYSASKFAVEAITDAFRNELRQWGIEVVAIEPGRIDTPIWETSLERTKELEEKLSEEAVTLYKDAIEKVKKSARTASREAVPALNVAKVIETALTAKSPKTRYLVGPDAKIAGTIISKLPDKIKDRLISL